MNSKERKVYSVLLTIMEFTVIILSFKLCDVTDNVLWVIPVFIIFIVSMYTDKIEEKFGTNPDDKEEL